jgi:hypothetical protein
MAVGHEKQHQLEFGGSPVSTEFPGQLQFSLADRIPVLVLSQTFDEEAARAVRYSLVATVGPERPYYHRYPDVVLDVRMVTGWAEGAGGFVNALSERLRKLSGQLFVVATEQIPVAADVKVLESVQEAVDAAKAVRAERRRSALQG